jgi:Na+/melibiose symporter-like transporter
VTASLTPGLPYTPQAGCSRDNASRSKICTRRMLAGAGVMLVVFLLVTSPTLIRGTSDARFIVIVAAILIFSAIVLIVVGALSGVKFGYRGNPFRSEGYPHAALPAAG